MLPRIMAETTQETGTLEGHQSILYRDQTASRSCVEYRCTDGVCHLSRTRACSQCIRVLGDGRLRVMRRQQPKLTPSAL